jgi:hypothetical protein
VLFIMDSCYSGLALLRGGSPSFSQNYLNEMAHREARQMFTAGGADQQVADSGPNGHSVFTWTLLQGLDGRADLNGDGVITATELAAYVAPAVSALSHQTPAFGSLPGSEGGDFIFELKHETEFLNQDSAQLGEEGIKLNAELEELRAQMRQESRQNEELRAQLEAAQAQLKQGASSAAPTAGATASAPADPTAAALVAPRVDAPVALNAEAAVKFIEMSIAQPASALTAQASSTSAWDSPLRSKMMSSAGVVPPVVANREVAPGYILPDVFATWREEIRKSTAGEITRQLAADAILVKEMTIRHMKLAEESAKGLWWSPCGFNGSAQSELTIDDCGLPIGSAPFSFAFSL